MVNYNRTRILRRYGDMEPQIFWGHDLDFSGHVTSSVMRSFNSQYIVSYKWSIETTVLSRMIAAILRAKHPAAHFPIKNAVITILGIWRQIRD